MESPLQRKLVAILYADVAGYSRLTGTDEEGTHRRLSAALDRFTAAIGHYHGSVVHYAGDAVLAEFKSVLDACRCAIDFQTDAATMDSGIPTGQRVQFRIGVNLGEVIVDRNDIFGDGVNIAARLESLAQAGGICISQAAYEQVKPHLPVHYRDLGEQRVKNIARPVRAYEITLSTGAIPVETAAAGARTRLLWIPLLLTLSVAGAGAWWLMTRQDVETPQVHASPNWLDRRIDLLLETHPEQSYPAAQSLPSIAVLPLRDLGADPGQEYFSDGLTNDIITDLSRFRDLMVIAAGTMATFKDRELSARQVSSELGARYVVDGEVERHPDNLRISVRLTDGATERQIWAQRFDRSGEDLFELRDEIVGTIVGSLVSRISRAELAKALRKETDSLEAHDYLLRGWASTRDFGREHNLEARRLFQLSVDLDPHYATAHAALAYTFMRDFWYGWSEFPDRTLDRAEEYAQRAVRLDDTNPEAHLVLGEVHLHRGRHGAAQESFERAFELNTNHPRALIGLAKLRLWTGELDASIDSFRAAYRLDPLQLGPAARSDISNYALALYMKGDTEQAITILVQDVGRRPGQYYPVMLLAAAYARQGNDAEAREMARRLRRIYPFFKAESFNMFRDPENNRKVIEALQKAGL